MLAALALLKRLHLNRDVRWRLKRQVLSVLATPIALAPRLGHGQRLSPAYSSVRPELPATATPPTVHWSGPYDSALLATRAIAGPSTESPWKSRALRGALIGVVAAAVIATGPLVICGSFGDRSQCPSYWLTVAKASTITVPLGVLMGLAGYLPDPLVARTSAT